MGWQIVGWWLRWRRSRREAEFIKLALQCLYDAAEDRLRLPLDDAGRLQLTLDFLKWLESDTARIDMLLDSPVRTLHLFLSENIVG